MIEIVNTLKGILSVLEDIAEALTPADDSKAISADEPKQEAKEEAEEPKEEQEPEPEPEPASETKTAARTRTKKESV